MKAKRRCTRHQFRFKVRGLDGKLKELTPWAKVKEATRPVELVLTADHVRKSIKLKGVGNTATCSAAVCVNAQPPGTFPHPTEGGYVDWQYSVAFVSSKMSRETGLPSECYAYEHNDPIARLNDTKGGQKKLLAMLEANGPRKIKLWPRRARPSQAGEYRPEGTKDGSRSKRLGTGAKLRFAVAQLGGAL